MKNELNKEMLKHQQWLKAQEAERRFHHSSVEIGHRSYFETYRQYFEWLGMTFNCYRKIILEIGPADFPALAYCRNYLFGYIIEPMNSPILEGMIKGEQTRILKKCAEDLDWDKEFCRVDEIWLFNVLQHVKDPDIIIEKAKNILKDPDDRICFFEPINCGISDTHLWNFDLEYFRRHFGDYVKYYPGNKNAVNFHTHECAFGVWIFPSYKA